MDYIIDKRSYFGGKCNVVMYILKKCENSSPNHKQFVNHHCLNINER